MGFKRVIGSKASQFRGIAETCFSEIAQNCSALINHSMTLTLEDCCLANKQLFLDKHLPRMVFVKLEIEGAASGDVFLLLDLKQAITFSGLLQVMISSSVAEKRSLMAFDDNDRDACKEIINIMRGAINQSLTDTTGLKLHVRQNDFVIADLDHPQSQDARLLPDCNFVVAMGRFSVQKFGDAEFYLLWPRVLAETVSGGEFEVAPTVLMLKSEEGDMPFDPVRFDLITYSLTDGKYGPVQDFILKNIDSNAIVLDVPEGVGNTVEICRKIKNDPKIRHLPLIATLRLPTRAVVTAVIEAGVDELLIIPTTEEVVRERLLRLQGAAA